MKVNNYDVLKVMGERNLNVKLAPLSNILRMKKTKAGTEITIGVEGDEIFPLMQGKYYGGFLLADKAEFEALKEEMEKV